MLVVLEPDPACGTDIVPCVITLRGMTARSWRESSNPAIQKTLFHADFQRRTPAYEGRWFSLVDVPIAECFERIA